MAIYSPSPDWSAEPFAKLFNLIGDDELVTR